ncbi:MAG: DUF3810 domain-containing protein [Lachnospiraceae bacterium]|nr:DUF3810 domain-containing protein [Lachnospiraceae bacterium]
MMAGSETIIRKSIIDTNDKERKRYFYKRVLFLLLAPIGYILLFKCRNDREFAEKVFAQKIFKGVSTGISFLTGKLPFSLAEASIVIGIPLVVFIIIAYFVVLKIRGGKMFKHFLLLLLDFCCIGSIVYFVYAYGCGANYYRYDLTDHLGLTVSESTQEELEGLLTELAKKATSLREGLTEDADGCYAFKGKDTELAEMARKSYIELAKEYPIFGGNYPAPKAVYFSRFMSKMNLTGIYTCWTMEANVNVDIPDYSLASTMCHELAHLRGFIREDEANYIGYLACMASPEAELKYSGTMMALIYTGNALYAQDADSYIKIREAYYSDEVMRDLIANSVYWKQFEEEKVAKITEAANDTYLKANGEEDGTKSYGRMVDLLLAQYKARKNSFTIR